jgi:hypothetical protein
LGAISGDQPSLSGVKHTNETNSIGKGGVGMAQGRDMTKVTETAGGEKKKDLFSTYQRCGKVRAYQRPKTAHAVSLKSLPSVR